MEHHELIFTQQLMFKANQHSSASSRDQRQVNQLLVPPIKTQTRAKPSKLVRTHPPPPVATSPSSEFQRPSDTQATSVKDQTQQLFHFKSRTSSRQLKSRKIAHQRQLLSRRRSYKKFQIWPNRGERIETNC